jgi:hypothetical protein
MLLQQEVLLKETLQKLEDEQKQRKVLCVMLLKYGTIHLIKKKKKNIDNSQKASHFPFIAWGSTTEYVYLIEIEN